MKIEFHENVNDDLLKYAVVIAKYQGKWAYCKHRERLTYEIPGGHREKGESIEETARRELFEETGAKKYELIPICVYSVTDKGETSYGMLYYADLIDIGVKPTNEIEKVYYLDDHPEKQTYPEIQPKLIAEAKRRGIVS